MITCTTNIYTQIDSPIGTIILTSDGQALTGLYTSAHKYEAELSDRQSVSVDRSEILSKAKEELQLYFAGKLTEFTVPVAKSGTPFQQRVYEQLCLIPYGETISYGELAARVGNPNASRAVGMANGRNPISIIVPCHRVIGANGTLTGYGGGLPRKQFLLELEKANASCALDR